MRRAVPLLLLAVSALPAATACGDESSQASPQTATPTPSPPLTVDSSTIKRDGGRLITALRGTTAPGATVEVDGRETTADASGRWAIRAAYDRSRSTIELTATIPDATPATLAVRQPLRPKLRLISSTGPTTTSDLTVIKGRVRASKGSLRGVRVTVNGTPAKRDGSRWSLPVTIEKGTRRFTIRATKPGADSGQLTIRTRRKLSDAERAARKAQREAEAAARKARQQAARAAEEATAACDPNYSGACLTPGSGDYDCAGGSGDGPNYVSGPVTVTGSDPYDLDRDGDGVGCE